MHVPTGTVPLTLTTLSYLGPHISLFVADRLCPCYILSIHQPNAIRMKNIYFILSETRWWCPRHTVQVTSRNWSNIRGSDGEGSTGMPCWQLTACSRNQMLHDIRSTNDCLYLLCTICRPWYCYHYPVTFSRVEKCAPSQKTELPKAFFHMIQKLQKHLHFKSENLTVHCPNLILHLQGQVSQYLVLWCASVFSIMGQADCYAGGLPELSQMCDW